MATDIEKFLKEKGRHCIATGATISKRQCKYSRARAFFGRKKKIVQDSWVCITKCEYYRPPSKAEKAEYTRMVKWKGPRSRYLTVEEERNETVVNG